MSGERALARPVRRPSVQTALSALAGASQAARRLGAPMGVSEGVALLKQGAAVDKASKAADLTDGERTARQHEACDLYAKGVAVLDEVLAQEQGVTPAARAKLSARRDEVQKRIKAITKKMRPTATEATPPAVDAANEADPFKAAVATIKAAKAADDAAKRGDSSKRADAVRLYRQGLEQIDQVVASGKYKDSITQALSTKRAIMAKRLAALEQSAGGSTGPEPQKRSAPGSAVAAGRPISLEPGEYKLRVSCRVFDGPEVADAEKGYLYSLDAGEIFVLTETAVDAAGAVKVRSADGWISYLDEGGRPALIGAAGASEPSAAGNTGERAPATPSALPGEPNANPTAGTISVTFASACSFSTTIISILKSIYQMW